MGAEPAKRRSELPAGLERAGTYRFRPPPSSSERLLVFVYRLGSAVVSVFTAGVLAAAYGWFTGWSDLASFLPVIGVVIGLVTLLSEQLRALAFERFWGIELDREVLVVELVRQRRERGLPGRADAHSLSTPSPARPGNDRLSRVLNITLSLTAALWSSPVLLLAALLVKLSSPGPVIALEMRIGGNRRWIDRKPRVDRRRDDLGGKPFELYRFRTTYEGKVTQVGRFLRATRINELPQYGNVIRGDMNLVGPRPVSPAAFQDLRQVLRDFEHRQSVLPGITGLAQISCDPATDFEDLRRSVELDLEYVSDRSLVKDLRILTRTVRFAIRRIRIRSDK